MSEQNNRERISVTKCRSILKQTGVGLSDEQIMAIRNYLYDLAQIDYDIFLSIEKREQAQAEESEKIKSINKNENENENEKSESADFKEAA